MRRSLVVVVTALTMLGLGGVGGPAQAKVSGPNGRIAFSRFDPSLPMGDTVTYIVNPDGSKLRLIFPGQNTGVPRWSPDGSKLAFDFGDDNPCPPCAASTVIFNPDTGSFRVFPPPDPNLASDCSIWSPDAKRFACEVGSPDGSRNGIYTIRTSDGRGLTQITSNPSGDDVPIDYSPNGTQIVFGRTDPNGPSGSNHALFVVNVNGSGLRRITPWGFSDDDGSWSPDGTTIVFEHSGSLFTVHPDGTGLAKIPLATHSRSFAGDVGWSPDGTKIVFILFTPTGPKSFQEGIATANGDGSDVQVVTTSPTFDSKADWGPHPLAT